MKIQVKVKPRARVSSFEETGDGVWLAHLKAPPIGGKASKELVALVAAHFDLPKSAVTVKSGASGRIKWVQLEEG
ncbi:hypothetical protein BH24DEI2_BH24DEI2_24330 [soil metagenome]